MSNRLWKVGKLSVAFSKVESQCNPWCWHLQAQGVKWSHQTGHAYWHFTVIPFLRDTVKVFKLILRIICWDFRTGLFDLSKNCIVKVERWTFLWVHKCVLKKILKYGAVGFQDYLAFLVWGFGRKNILKNFVKNWWVM